MKEAAVVSIHDVGPRTLPHVLGLVRLLADAGAPPATLLVVPGRDWPADALDTVRTLVRDGHHLAGHGWSHRAPEPASLGHRIHGLVLSRDQAEHLSRPREELVEIVERCHAWFGERGLPVPDLYVPPAWALGSLTPTDLTELPFRWYETLTGFLDARTGRRRTLPLVGFEADTALRKWALRASNAGNLALARAWGRPVRISLHPRDPELLLARDLERLLGRRWNFTTVEHVMGSAGTVHSREG